MMELPLRRLGYRSRCLENSLTRAWLKTPTMTNAFTAVGALRALIDFTLSNARRFYSSMGKPLVVKGLRGGLHSKVTVCIICFMTRFIHDNGIFKMSITSKDLLPA